MRANIGKYGAKFDESKPAVLRSVRADEDYALLSCQITMQRAAGHSIDLYRKQSCAVKFNHKRLSLFNPYCHQM